MAGLYLVGPSYKRCFHLILISLRPWPNPYSPQALPTSRPFSLHPNQPPLLCYPLCLASNHFFLALISPCRAASNQKIMVLRAQQGTLPGRGSRPQAPGHHRKLDPESLLPSTPALVPVLVSRSPGQGGTTSA